MVFDYQCTFNLDDCIRTLGLDEKGRVQQVIDHTFLKGVKPYVPFLEGTLIDSGRIEEPGLIVWDADNKARRLYYGEEDWNWSNGGVQDGGLRGPYWAERYIQDGGREQIEKAAREAVKR